MTDRPSSSFRRVQKYSIVYNNSFQKGNISRVGFRDTFALPIAEVKLEADDLCKDEFHRKKQLAKVTVKKFIDLGFIKSEDLLEYLMDKRLLHPARGIIVCTMFDRQKYEARK